jgi:hypothetical protein
MQEKAIREGSAAVAKRLMFEGFALTGCLGSGIKSDLHPTLGSISSYTLP